MSVRDGFVKSADTGVSVDRSAAELQKLLRAAFPECAPALADTTVTPRRGR